MENKETPAATPAAQAKRSRKTGKVVSAKMEKTVVVEVTRTVKNPQYGRFQKQSARFLADDRAVLDALPDGAFPFVVSNHSLEHMPGPDSAIVDTLSRWLRKLRVGGVLALVIPDNDCFDVLKSDVDHKSAWGASDFGRRILEPLVARGGGEVLAFNTLDNNFSFDVTLRAT